MKKWIFSFAVISMIAPSFHVHADGEIDAPPAYSADSAISPEQKNAIFSIFSVYRDKKDNEEAVQALTSLNLSSKQMDRLADEINQSIGAEDIHDLSSWGAVLALENQIQLLKDAKERRQFMKLADVLKSFRKIDPAIRSLGEDKIVVMGAKADTDLGITMEQIKSFMAYVQNLPLAEQVEIQEGTINQLEYLVKKATIKRNSSQEQVESSDNDGVFWSAVSTVGGVGWVRIFSKDAFFYSRKGLITSAIFAIAMGGTTFYLQNRRGEKLINLLAADQKELDNLRTNIAEQRAELEDRKAMLALEAAGATEKDPTQK